ncbi:PID-CTERM protein-sorting domain-containing protein [Hyunsoonleella rubra]|uniref:PID-CTERM protein-sorting domain-containing protein n=1 Tax=Hyunsoonleella rubra TaxID=1737062 RepID=A0ABW5T8P6_9FLAO
MKNTKKMISKTTIALFVIFALFATANLTAQPGFNDNVKDVPLDGGLFALLIGAAAFGVKKLRDSRK